MQAPKCLNTCKSFLCNLMHACLISSAASHMVSLCCMPWLSIKWCSLHFEYLLDSLLRGCSWRCCWIELCIFRCAFSSYKGTSDGEVSVNDIRAAAACHSATFMSSKSCGTPGHSLGSHDLNDHRCSVMVKDASSCKNYIAACDLLLHDSSKKVLFR